MLSFKVEGGRVVDLTLDGVPHALKIVRVEETEVEVQFCPLAETRGVAVVLTPRAAELLRSEYANGREWRFDLLVIVERQAGDPATLEADVDNSVVW